MRDEWFIRGQVPMTKSEIRAVSLSKLELSTDSVLWDIGAGTGSVSVEAACLYPGLSVWAFERNPEAVSLIRRNTAKAGTDRIRIVEGCAPDSFAGCPAPSHAFLGGTSGRMEEILDALLLINPDIRIVLNVIALESLAALLACLNKKGIEAEYSLIQTARSSKAGQLHLMKGQNPVYIISFGGGVTGVNDAATEVNGAVTGMNDTVTEANNAVAEANDAVTGANDAVTGENEKAAGKAGTIQ